MSSLDKGPWTTKLSSAGLVYAFYGKEAIKNIVGTDDQKLVDMVYDKVRRQLCVVSNLCRRTNIALSLGGLAMFVVVQDPGEKKFNVFSCWCVQIFPRWGQSCQNVQNAKMYKFLPWRGKCHYVKMSRWELLARIFFFTRGILATYQTDPTYPAKWCLRKNPPWLKLHPTQLSLLRTPLLLTAFLLVGSLTTPKNFSKSSKVGWVVWLKWLRLVHKGRGSSPTD